MAGVTITPQDNGPNRVRGPVTVLDLKGNLIREIPEGQVAAFCRCGHSQTKPFCDGTHSKVGFESVVRAADFQKAEETD